MGVLSEFQMVSWMKTRARMDQMGRMGQMRLWVNSAGQLRWNGGALHYGAPCF
jgi:hypothetical protein